MLNEELRWLAQETGTKEGVRKMKFGLLFVGWKRAELVHRGDPHKKVRLRSWLLFGLGQWGLAVMHNETKSES